MQMTNNKPIKRIKTVYKHCTISMKTNGLLIKYNYAKQRTEAFHMRLYI